MYENARFKARFWIVFLASITLSLGGILLSAIYITKTADAGLGGAAGVAVAVAFMFITREYGTLLYIDVIRGLRDLDDCINEIAGERQAEQTRQDSVARIQNQVDVLVAAIDTNAEGQKSNNYFLAFATFVGTIAWGFGDRIAECLLKSCCWRRFASVIVAVASAFLPSGTFQRFWAAKCGEPPPITMTDRCVVNDLPDLVPPNAQYPSDCLEPVIDRFQKDQPILILLVGRTDKRQLNSEGRHIYGDNFTLGYQRAASMRDYLLERYRKDASAQKMPLTSDAFARRIVVLTAGPDHIDPKTTDSEKSDDRCVEVFVYWNSGPNLERAGP